MQLTVSVEDRSGVLQFLRVRTRKSAPLHASLDNELQNPLYWYDITGPRHDTNWFTPSEQLQVGFSVPASLVIAVVIAFIIIIAVLS